MLAFKLHLLKYGYTLMYAGVLTLQQSSGPETRSQIQCTVCQADERYSFYRYTSPSSGIVLKQQLKSLTANKRGLAPTTAALLSKTVFSIMMITFLFVANLKVCIISVSVFLFLT